jgi:hypothetical protein
MESFRLAKNLIFLSTFLFVLLTFAAPILAFLTSSDLSESTEEYALLLVTPDGSIHGAKAKLNPLISALSAPANSGPTCNTNWRLPQASGV